MNKITQNTTKIPMRQKSSQTETCKCGAGAAFEKQGAILGEGLLQFEPSKKAFSKLVSDEERFRKDGAEKPLCNAGSDGESSPSLRIARSFSAALIFWLLFYQEKSNCLPGTRAKMMKQSRKSLQRHHRIASTATKSNFISNISASGFAITAIALIK